MMATQDQRWWDLATYNAERARGLVHTPEWEARMAELQAAFDAEQDKKRRADGWTPYYANGVCVGWIQYPPETPIN